MLNWLTLILLITSIIMNDKDILQRFIFENVSVRGELVRLEDSFQTIMQQHNYPPLIQQILGEVLVAASLLSASIKFKGQVTVQFQGKKKLKLLLAQCSHELQLRGLAQWQDQLQEAELLTELKQGLLAIMMDPAVSGGNRYQGMVTWQGDSLAQSIEGYFKQSEQVPTRLWIAVNAKHAAGLFIQSMPRESARLGKTSANEHWEHISHLSATITAHELLMLDNMTLLRRLYAEEDVRLFTPKSVKFGCTCSLERGENALRLLGREEVEQELHAKQKIVVTCEFCSKEFVFDRVDVERIFKQDKPDSSNKVN